MSKKGILVVSFGTTHVDTREKTIEAIENAIKNEFPQYKVYRAFTSNMVMRLIEKYEKLYIFDVEEAIWQMLEDGIEEIIIQPTHVIKGIEYEKIVKIASKYENKFKEFSISKPLLSEKIDYVKAANIILDEVKIVKEIANIKHAFIFMGHGTEHEANKSYTNLQEELLKKGYKNIFIATVEGTPNIEDIIEIMELSSFNSVTLIPFMIVAGDHAKNDMAGDDEDSWKSILENKGYEVNYILKGLGEIKEVQDMFIEHVKSFIK